MRIKLLAILKLVALGLVSFKLMLPLIPFIFPAIFVVLAGPAALNMIKMFNSGLL